MAGTYSPRIQAFRDSMIKALPRAPNDKASRASLEAQLTRQLILAFITWRMRLISRRARGAGLSQGATAQPEPRQARLSMLCHDFLDGTQRLRHPVQCHR